MSKHEYNGDPIDASWQTPPWQNKGETLDAYDSDGDGKIMTTEWPENATDPEELNENQKKMILTAARYPSLNDREKLVELSGLDVSVHYPNYTLRTHWPERYWCETNPEDFANAETVDKLRQQLLDGGSLNQLSKKYPVSQSWLSQLVRGEAKDLPDCDTPPVTFLNDSEQRWVSIESEEANEDSRGAVTATVEELRERALNGEAAKEIAEDFGITAAPIRKRLKGHRHYGDDSDIPALDYNPRTQEWYVPDDTEEEPPTTDTEEEPPTTDTMPKPDESTTPTPDTPRDGTPGWVWAVVIAAAAWIVSKLLR